MSMESYPQAFATVLSLINPTICALIFGRSQAGRPEGQRVADATKASIAILVTLSLAALFGARVLQTFGVSLDAFSVAGARVVQSMMGLIVIAMGVQFGLTGLRHFFGIGS